MRRGQADRQAGRQTTDMTKIIVAVRNFANAPKNGWLAWLIWYDRKDSNPYLNLCISSPFSKLRLYGATDRYRPWAPCVASSTCLSIASVSNILCLVSTWNSIVMFHCIFFFVFLQVFCHRLYCIIYFSKHVHFSEDKTERNSTVFIKVITDKHTSAKICKEIIINFTPLLGFDEKTWVINSLGCRL
jgi:hypothetical protein